MYTIIKHNPWGDTRLHFDSRGEAVAWLAQETDAGQPVCATGEDGTHFEAQQVGGGYLLTQTPQEAPHA